MEQNQNGTVAVEEAYVATKPTPEKKGFLAWAKRGWKKNKKKIIFGTLLLVAGGTYFYKKGKKAERTGELFENSETLGLEETTESAEE